MMEISSSYAAPERGAESTRQPEMVGEIAADAWASMGSDINKNRAGTTATGDTSLTANGELVFSSPYESQVNGLEKIENKPGKHPEDECSEYQLGYQEMEKLKAYVLRQVDKLFDREHELSLEQRKELFNKLLATRLEELECNGT